MPEPDSAADQTPAEPAAAKPPPSDTRPAPVYQEPLPADDGAVRLKVLIGGVLFLFALTLVGLVFMVIRGKTPPPEPVVPSAPAHRLKPEPKNEGPP